MTTPEDRARLVDIKAMVATLPNEFHVATDSGEGLCLDMRAKDGTGFQTVARFLADIPYSVMDAFRLMPANYRFLLWLIGEASKRIRHLEQRLAQYEPPEKPEPEPKQRRAWTPANEAGRLCASKAFRRFLAECHGLPDDADADRAATKLRFMLQITSRSEIDTNPSAQAGWKKLKKEFETWMRPQ